MLIAYREMYIYNVHVHVHCYKYVHTDGDWGEHFEAYSRGLRDQHHEELGTARNRQSQCYWSSVEKEVNLSYIRWLEI